MPGGGAGVVAVARGVRSRRSGRRDANRVSPLLARAGRPGRARRTRLLVVQAITERASGARPARSALPPGMFAPLFIVAALVLPYLPWLADAVPSVDALAGPGRWWIWAIALGQIAWLTLTWLIEKRGIATAHGWRAPLLVFAGQRRDLPGQRLAPRAGTRLSRRRRTALPRDHAEPADAITISPSKTTMHAATIAPITPAR